MLQSFLGPLPLRGRLGGGAVQRCEQLPSARVVQGCCDEDCARLASAELSADRNGAPCVVNSKFRRHDTIYFALCALLLPCTLLSEPP